MRLRTVSFAVLGAACAVPAHGGSLLLGPGEFICWDQPRVTIAIEDPANPGESVGPSMFDQALLDTGANGLMLGALAHYFGEQYDVAIRPNGTPVHYLESGVAGTSAFNTLKPYHFNYAGDNGVTFAVNNSRIMASEEIDLGSYAGVVGMPAMQGKILNVDLRPISEPWLTSVSFPNVRPAANPHALHVALSMLQPVHTGLEEPGDPAPTFAPLPLVQGVKQEFNGASSTETMLLDTGGQLTIIPTATAAALGLNLNPNDPNNHIVDMDEDGVITEADYMPLGGIGGEVLVPCTVLSKFIIPTKEGRDIVLTDLVVAVADIQGIGGVLGMNVLTSGYGAALESGDPETYGYFLNIGFDFTVPGDVDRDGMVNFNDYQILAKHMGTLAGATRDDGDLDGDGDVDFADFSLWKSRVGTVLTSGEMILDVNPDYWTAAAAAVPEPCAGAMALVVAAGLLRRRRR